MNPELIKMQNRLSEVGSANEHIQNKYHILEHASVQLRKAAIEASSAFAKMELGYELKPNEIATLKVIAKTAVAMYDNALDKDLRTPRQVTVTPPAEPQTNDHYFDGEKHHAFYLGKWHELA